MYVLERWEGSGAGGEEDAEEDALWTHGAGRDSTRRNHCSAAFLLARPNAACALRSVLRAAVRPGLKKHSRNRLLPDERISPHCKGFPEPAFSVFLFIFIPLLLIVP